jgi:phospholipid/cholesterol/gamma-HCH transport system substrate-binding protein
MKAVSLLLAAAVVLTGCEYRGAQSLPLPGAVSGDDTYRVTIVFSDATSLAPKETCRINDTVVGSVESVSLNADLQAEVVCVIRNSVTIPANAVGSLRETSLLGERYVALDPAAGTPARGRLEPGAVVPQTSTRVDPNAELVLGALSQLLNGGSLGTLGTITRELNTAMGSTDVAATADELGSLVSRLSTRRHDITASLTEMGRLSRLLARQRTVIADTLDTVPDGLRVLNRQRPRMTATLRRLARLSDVALPLIDRTKANTVADLHHLAPVLDELSKAGDDLARSVERIASFPFPSNFLSTVKGDYAGSTVTYALDVDALNQLLGFRSARSNQGSPSTSGPARLPDLPGLSGLLDLPELLGLPQLPLLGPVDIDGQPNPLLDLGQLFTGGTP